jgi:hypothetical protein
MHFSFCEALEPRCVLAAYVVDNAGDAVDGNYGPGQHTLREAVERANANSGAETVSFASGLQGQTITLTLGQIDITDDLTLAGPGAAKLAVSGNNNSRVFSVGSGVTASINGLTVTQGRTFGGVPGAGIYNLGSLAIADCTISNNSGASASTYGGGVCNGSDSLSITRSSITGNSAGYGGGVYNYYGIVTIAVSTLSSNLAADDGGGLFNLAGTVSINHSTLTGNGADNGGGVHNNSGSLTIANSSVIENNAQFGAGINGYGDITITRSLLTGNTASGSGGAAFFLTGAIAVLNSTISANMASSLGGGVYNGGSLTLANSTLANNASGSSAGLHNTSVAWLESSIVALNIGGDISGNNLANGSVYNLIGDAGSAGGLSNGLNIVGADPKLSPLADNGGPTRTHALDPTSPARDAGLDSFSLVTDQRGTGFARHTGGAVDIGAFEYGSTVDDFADAGGWASAAAVTINPNSGDGDRAGSIEVPGDTDLFKFTAAASGAAVITLDASSNFDGRFQVFDAAHVKLNPGGGGVWVNDRATGKDETWSLTLAANQVYFVLVGGWRNPGGGYTLRINGQSAPDDHPDAGAWSSADNVPIDPNNGNGSRTGEIEAAGDTDLFKFMAAGAGNATITLDVAVNFDGWFELYDAAHDFIARHNAKASGGDEAGSLTVAANTLYFVLVGGWRNPGGGYTLKIDGPPAPDDHADAGQWSTAAAVTLNGAGDGSRSGAIEAAGDTDLFKFAAPKSGSASITLDVAMNFDGWFEIYDANHQLVAPRRNANASGGDETLAFNAVAGQTYFILVGGWRNPGGAYNLLVNA